MTLLLFREYFVYVDSSSLPINNFIFFQAVAGLGTATYDVVLYSKPKGISNIVGRYAMHVGPLMGIATAFTTVTYAATKFRGKDDSLNYVLGGIAAGGVVGAWAKSFPTGCLAGIILGKQVTVNCLSESILINSVFLFLL